MAEHAQLAVARHEAAAGWGLELRPKREAGYGGGDEDCGRETEQATMQQIRP
jgi:hypothetical protein